MRPPVSKDDLLRSAALARLTVREEEIPALLRDISEMAQAVDLLRSVDIRETGTPPLIDTQTCRLRRDEALQPERISFAGTMPLPQWKRLQQQTEGQQSACKQQRRPSSHSSSTALEERNIASGTTPAQEEIS